MEEKAKCPWCGNVLDPELLKFAEGMRVFGRNEFCQRCNKIISISPNGKVSFPCVQVPTQSYGD